MLSTNAKGSRRSRGYSDKCFGQRAQLLIPLPLSAVARASSAPRHIGSAAQRQTARSLLVSPQKENTENSAGASLGHFQLSIDRRKETSFLKFLGRCIQQ